MATNEILRFAQTDTTTNLLTQAEYDADAQRLIGNQPGVARSKLVNKALRQASLISAGVAQFIAEYQSNNVTDGLTPANISDYLEAAIQAMPVAAGTAAAPSISPTGDTNTGLYFPAADRVAISTGGVQRVVVSDSGLGVNNITSATGGNTAQINGFTPTLSNMTGRNKIINGKMEIAQRGTSFPTSVVGSGTGYTLDRWAYLYVTAAAVIVSQQADAPANKEFQNSARITVTTADTTVSPTEYFVFRQNVEGYNVRDLIGRTFTLSFWVKSSKTGTHCISLSNIGADRTYIAEYTINVANTWEYKTITVTGGLITAGDWNWNNNVGLSATWTLMAGSNTQNSLGWSSSRALATANQVNCLDTVGNVFAVTGVQLEVGEVATPFEHRLYGQELALCQRYYTVIASATRQMYRNHGSDLGTTRDVKTFEPPVPMRSSPTAIVTYGSVNTDEGTSVPGSSLVVFAYSNGRLGSYTSYTSQPAAGVFHNAEFIATLDSEL
jgi:hypothetical protein